MSYHNHPSPVPVPDEQAGSYTQGKRELKARRVSLETIRVPDATVLPDKK